MSDQLGETIELSTRSSQQTTLRYFVAAPSSPLPGWLLLAFLLILGLWGVFITAPQIQDEVAQTVSDALQAKGINADVRGDGQRVTVTPGNNALSREDLHDHAQSVRCTTWSGPQVCPSLVKVGELPPVAIEPHNFTFTRSADQIILHGEVPSATMAAQIQAQAEARFATVQNNLTITDKRARTDYTNASDRALDLLAMLQRGEASWTLDGLAVTGLVSDTLESQARAAFNATADAPILDGISLQVAQSVASCEAQFADLMSRSTLNFRTGSATIEAGSEALFESLAQTAKICPGTLEVQGHTDSTGNATANQQLSQARAQAVVDALTLAGVRADRLSANGFGSSQPIADNATAQGRAANRRIVIRVRD